MKKFISLILACVMSLSVCNSVMAKEEKSDVMIQAAELLTKLDILNPDFTDFDSEAKRGFAVSIAAKMISTNITVNYTKKYSDVLESSPYMSEILFMSDMGYVDGYDNGKFLPDNAITYAEFSKMMMKMLGYDIYAQTDDNYPQGYLNAMNRLDIGISGKNAQSKITNAEMLVSMYNALMVVTSGVLTFEGNIINIGNRDSILQQRNVFQIKGIVSQVGMTALDYNVEPISGDEIKIGDYIIKTAQGNTLEYLGKTVTAYVREIKDSRKCELLSVVSASYKNEYIIHDDSNLTWSRNANNSVVLNYYEKAKKKTLTLEAEAQYFYNGRLTTDYAVIEKGLNLTQGNIRVLKTNKGTYVFLNEYIDVVVSAVNAKGYVLTDKLAYGEILLPVDDDNAYLGIHGDDGEKNFEDISVGDILSIFQSVDGTYSDIYLHDEKITGTVTCITEDGAYVVDGKEYKLNDGIKEAMANSKKGFKEIRANDTVDFYLNKYGRIVDVELARNDLTYAYMYEVKCFSNSEFIWDNKIAGFKLFNIEKGENLTYYALNSLDVNGVRCKTADAAGEQLQRLIAAWGKNEMLVKVKYKGDNEITAIEIPIKNSTDNDRLRWIANYDNTTPEEITRVGGKYIYDSSTTILQVYEGEEMVEKQTSSYLQKDFTKSYNYEIYDTDELNFAGAMVLRVESDYKMDNSAINYSEPVYIVENVGEVVLEEGEIAMSISAYENGGGTIKELTVSEQDIFNVDTNIDKTFEKLCYNVPLYNGERCGQYGYSYLSIQDLKKGDIIQVGYDVFGRVNRFRVLARLPEQLKNGHFDNLMWGGRINNPYSMLTYGVISYMNAKGFVLDFTNDTRIFITTSVPVLRYSRATQRFTVGSMSDITEGKEVLVRARKFALSFMVVIED